MTGTYESETGTIRNVLDSTGKETRMTDRKTSPKVASKASKVLRDPKSSKTDKTISGSAVSQAGGSKKKK